jgi:hypothetical protein
LGCARLAEMRTQCWALVMGVRDAHSRRCSKLVSRGFDFCKAHLTVPDGLEEALANGRRCRYLCRADASAEEVSRFEAWVAATWTRYRSCVHEPIGAGQ